MKMPAQKPHRSRQDYGSPREFLDAVERRFGPIAVDLAAHRENHAVDRWLGPGGEHENSFDVDWSRLAPGRWLWLNPPFSKIDPWAAKCAMEHKRGARIIMLTPASVSTEWFADHVEGKAFVIPLRPRLTFVDCEDPYPKDCALSVFDYATGFATWRWK